MTDHADERDDVPPADAGDERLEMEHEQPDQPGAENEPSPEEGQEVT